ncbi:MAG: hypothetical protein CMJ06_04355 [Pelagibacterales bacterium]|nr:hypothetical protein [Pelagibacterales bacterium]OUU61944.1 MAG: hypothetical protein CBC22_05805 [Alphaproteobacteria bacterium TMED62]|tara:strand:+ start:16955 stop:17485 length:531 start_codon:yes stop_codon:yes gene_type:complete
MKIKRKFKFLIIVISLFLSGHAPWGQHEVYRQMHMLVMCSKNDEGAFGFTKNLKVILDEYLPEAKARVARTKDSERLINLLITNQIPLAVISSNLLTDLKNKKTQYFQNLLKYSKTLYSFDNMILIVNQNFPKEYMEQVIESLVEASKNNNDKVKFIKKNNLVISYDEIVLEKIKF